MERLQGRVAVVTGAASGIGRAMAVRFAAEGMRVALADVEAAPLAAAVAEIRASGAQAIGVETDVRFESQVQALADAAIAEFGAVHLVCNNAGVETGGPFAEIPSSPVPAAAVRRRGPHPAPVDGDRGTGRAVEPGRKPLSKKSGPGPPLSDRMAIIHMY